MTLDTLTYIKAPEASGLEGKIAEAHAEASTKVGLPNLVTKADPVAAKVEREQAMERIKHHLTLRLIGIVGAFDAALFALRRFVH